MNESGIQITLKQLLARHQRIQIPMIQRDYAQGRPSVGEVREEFLETLLQAFTRDASDDALPLNLDFIYGSIAADTPPRFLPLDGQQRLTTLFLLHWYLAWRDGCQDEFKQVFCDNAASRFYYSVRPSSTEFFDQLVNFWPTHEAAGQALDRLISDQPWYFRHWRLDPTIQSCMVMLQAIHKRFASLTGAYAQLVDDQRPVITFQLLDLDHFGLSDDLYIKMNARGKPLTAFETFKARHEHELKAQFAGESRDLGGTTVSVADFFARRMDTRWADFFWEHRDEQTHLYDDAIMNFLHVVAFICRQPQSPGYLENIGYFRNRPLRADYALYHKEGWLDRDFSATLMLLLETWSARDNRFTPLLPDNPYFNEQAMVKRLVKDPEGLAYHDLVQVFAYVAFVQAAGEHPDPRLLLDWMRVICNLSVNTSYERPADMQRSLLAVQSLLPQAGNILSHFASQEKPTAGFYLQQINEEQFKAELLLAHQDWRALLEKAERHGYFKGQIEFLLAFSGALDKRRETVTGQWTPAEHATLQQAFCEYLDKAQTMFSTRGLNSLPELRWERALLSLGDYLLASGSNRSLLVNSASEQASWKRLLRGGAGYNEQQARVLLHRLLEQIDPEAAPEAQLDELIAKATDLEPWRQIIVQTPAVLRLCGERALRRDGEEIYLLKKSRMSGMHAELFSYHLHLQLEAEPKKLLPLRLGDYQLVNGSEFEPCLYMVLDSQRRNIPFTIFSVSGNFRIQANRKPVKALPELEKLLSTTFSFTVHKEAKDILMLDVARKNIHATLRKLAKALKALEAQAADTV